MKLSNIRKDFLPHFEDMADTIIKKNDDNPR